ncbi:MAG: hypothetical protein ACYT04_66005, partial [Nostoc sp.]
QSEQVFENPSGTPQEHITNSSKELVMCVSSSHYEIPQGEETAHAPFGGASPQIVESKEEIEEELPTATDCTTRRRVDEQESQPASLLVENQDCGVEPRDSYEGEGSAAASIAEEKKELTQSELFDWLDRADAGVCPPLWVIQYLLDSKYYHSMRASISKFEQQWGISVINYRVQKTDLEI